MPGPNTRRVSSLHTRNQHTWPLTSRGSTQRNTAWGSGANNGQGLCPLLDSKIETADKESAQELSWVQEVSSISNAASPPGNLPTTRTQGTNLYRVIGVDYAGPI